MLEKQAIRDSDSPTSRASSKASMNRPESPTVGTPEKSPMKLDDAGLMIPGSPFEAKRPVSKLMPSSDRDDLLRSNKLSTPSQGQTRSANAQQMTMFNFLIAMKTQSLELNQMADAFYTSLAGPFANALKEAEDACNYVQEQVEQLLEIREAAFNEGMILCAYRNRHTIYNSAIACQV